MKILFSLLFILCAVCFLKAQDLKINIDKAKQEISSNINTFEKVEIYKDEISYNYNFLKDGKLQIKVVYVIQDGIEKKVEWYFERNKLIFAEQIWTDINTKNIVQNSKAYVKNSTLIEWINNGVSVDSNSEEFKNYQKELKEYILKLKEKSVKEN
jgi:hypothetical protein